ncbi:uncharacterized protein [Clytia hemisphaerica]|uniref:Chitin-binding type-2 domain-containing protein n=1 Tax=Clytia hemisphaerica TaxID=252671 RepID=A0A7M5WTL2_9CNID
MIKIAIIAALFAVSMALEVPQAAEGPHIAKDVDCPSYLCNGKPDGNFEYRPYSGYVKNQFVQCVDGKPSCQVCWPKNLEFSEKCNQCLYSAHDECVSTVAFSPAVTSFCPDKCPHRGPKFSGNIADSDNNKHYIACWEGVTVGCVDCPKGLLFNEQWNACLYNGVHITKPGSH